MPNEPNDAPPADAEAVDRARRLLLKSGLYAAPFIATFGVFAGRAAAQATSPCVPFPFGCPPASCVPCAP
jgi:hypothetical protein